MTISNSGHSYNLEFSISREIFNGTLETEENEEIDFFTSEFLKDKAISTKTFNALSTNDIEVLIDGMETFGRYYHYLQQAKYSIDILGWELSLSFGLIYEKQPPKNHLLDRIQQKFSSSGNWKHLQDVLLERASKGVKIRIMIWRHQFISYITRFLYLGEVTIEREVKKLQNKAANMGLKVKVYHTEFNLPNSNSKYADPFKKWIDADIVFVLVGNPKGVVSCHHEKLLLIDGQYPNRAVAFTGGFDIARGRYDTPKHNPPQPIWDVTSLLKEAREGRSIQPFFSNLNIGLWHDIQIMIKGPSTQTLLLHFIQRWVHAFTNDNHKVRELKLPTFSGGEPMIDPKDSKIHKDCTIRVIRAWPRVLEKHQLLENFITIINNASNYLYFEHQYPFQNFILTQCMCDALKRNQNLYVIMIIPIKTDLPTGIVGSYLDMSQDHINEHLELIYKTAPDRVGIYGLVRQESTTKQFKSIYIHSKLLIVDDKIMCIGTSNTDNLSFYQSSEINVNIYNEGICKETKERLIHEHLEYYNKEMNEDFKYIYNEFEKIANLNHESLIKNQKLIGRIIHLCPDTKLKFISNLVDYPSPIAKTIYKFGWNYQFILRRIINNLQSSTDANVNSFFLQSML